MIYRAWNLALEGSFNRWASTYTHEVPLKLERRGYSYPSLAKIIVDQVAGHLPPQRPMTRWLELGAGTGLLGWELRRLLQPRTQLVGLDISPEMLKLAKDTSAYDQTICSTAELLPIESESCDVIVSAFMMHSVLRRNASISEMHRVLKSGGVLALVDLYRTSRRWPVLSFLRDNLLSAKYEHGAPSRYVSMREMSLALKRASFHIGTEILLDSSMEVADLKAGRRMHGLVVGLK